MCPQQARREGYGFVGTPPQDSGEEQQRKQDHRGDSAQKDGYEPVLEEEV